MQGIFLFLIPRSHAAVTKNYLGPLRTLAEDDVVTKNGQHFTVKYVDRFTRTVTICNAEGHQQTVHASALAYNDETLSNDGKDLFIQNTTNETCSYKRRYASFNMLKFNRKQRISQENTDSSSRQPISF